MKALPLSTELRRGLQDSSDSRAGNVFQKLHFIMSTSLPQPDERGALPVDAPLLKSRKALARVPRELAPEDLANPGVQKMLIEELERAEEETTELKGFREKFYGADKDLAVTKQKLTGWSAMEMISTACIASGAAAFAYAPEAANTAHGGWVAVAFGVVLTAIGIIAKAIRI